MTYVLMNN